LGLHWLLARTQVREWCRPPPARPAVPVLQGLTGYGRWGETLLLLLLLLGLLATAAARWKGAGIRPARDRDVRF
jgi:hypothetical protein